MTTSTLIADYDRAEEKEEEEEQEYEKLRELKELGALGNLVSLVSRLRAPMPVAGQQKKRVRKRAKLDCRRGTCR